MARVTVEDCLTQETNRFALVLLAAQRAKQLLTGAKSRINDTDNKQVVTALREIADGQVRFMTADDLAKKLKKEEAEREAALAEAKSMAASQERLSNGGFPDESNGHAANGNGNAKVKLAAENDAEDLFKDEETGSDE